MERTARTVGFQKQTSFSEISKNFLITSSSTSIFDIQQAYLTHNWHITTYIEVLKLKFVIDNCHLLSAEAVFMVESIRTAKIVKYFKDFMIF